MKKIVITGGLGYIGTELCKIYSGYSWNDKITVIDNRFISERVNQIRNWNMDFVQGDILDKELIKKHCIDADIVHHLAGITDVPRVKSQSNLEDDQKIKRVAEEGTQNILDVISDKCKIIMPSTHVVFEGIEKVKNDIQEDENTYKAETRYKIIRRLSEGLTHIELKPSTGRKHQLRIHCKLNGFPILGDNKYYLPVSKVYKNENNLFLHAKKIKFNDLTGELINVEADLPNHFFNYI